MGYVNRKSKVTTNIKIGLVTKDFISVVVAPIYL